MIYDIHTKKAAQETLQCLTGITITQWEENLYRERNYQLQDNFVEAMIKEFGINKLPKSYADMNYIFFHITTSANLCESIRKNGILDLQEAYRCIDSELRSFLDSHGIVINLDDEFLNYNGKIFDIHYDNYYEGRLLNHNSDKYKCRSIGRKFYYDYTICGFLSAWSHSPYDGMVHRRPEILQNIDELLGTKLSWEWERTHIAYEIVAKANGRDICYPYNDNSPEEEKVLTYIVMAYNEAFNGNSENIMLLKNRVQIPPEDILEIKPFITWK